MYVQGLKWGHHCSPLQSHLKYEDKTSNDSTQFHVSLQRTLVLGGHQQHIDKLSVSKKNYRCR